MVVVGASDVVFLMNKGNYDLFLFAAAGGMREGVS